MMSVHNPTYIFTYQQHQIHLDHSYRFVSKNHKNCHTISKAKMKDKLLLGGRKQSLLGMQYFQACVAGTTFRHEAFASLISRTAGIWKLQQHAGMIQKRYQIQNRLQRDTETQGQPETWLDGYGEISALFHISVYDHIIMINRTVCFFLFFSCLFFIVFFLFFLLFTTRICFGLFLCHLQQVCKGEHQV